VEYFGHVRLTVDFGHRILIVALVSWHVTVPRHFLETLFELFFTPYCKRMARLQLDLLYDTA